MRKIVFATNNAGKLNECREIVAPWGVEMLSISDVTLMQPNLSSYRDPTEGETSYCENARIKARSCFDWCGLPCIGDDSGLEVSALGGAPGIISARYAGVGASAEMNKRKLLEDLSGTTDRRASIRCVLCFVKDSTSEQYFEGVLECEIAQTPRGNGGFGYDPLLIVAGTNKTLAELKDEGIEVATHRALALGKLARALALTEL